MRRLIAAIALLLVLSVPAHAMPARWRGSAAVTREGVTYRVRAGDAVVVCTTGTRVRIPPSVIYRGRRYVVRNIWRTALRGASTVVLRADLDGCDCRRLWSRHVTVYAYDRGTHDWLLSSGANVVN